MTRHAKAILLLSALAAALIYLAPVQAGLALYSFMAGIFARRFVYHLAYQPRNETEEVAETPDWRFGIAWGVLGGLLWPLLVTQRLTQLTRPRWPAFPFQGRYERAAIKRKREREHEARLRDLDMLP